MTVHKALICSLAGAALVVALIGGSPLSAGEVIHSGVDLWMTVAGFARADFAKDPLPAGFFCEGSQPFASVVKFKGAPLAVEPAGSLGSIDTVVRRLDDAKFDAKGEAVTRIELMALALVSTQPIETSCGQYDVAVSLTGKQPVTTMQIFQAETSGGTYSAPLSLNVKAVFTPVDGNKNAAREVTRHIELGPSNHSVWAYINLPRYPAGVRIDTNGDGRPDTVLPPSSNFLAGISPAVLKETPPLPQQAATSTTPISCPVGQCPYQSCHCTSPQSNPPPTWNQPADTCAHLHCLWTCAPSGATAPNGAVIHCMSLPGSGT
ncbi:MAG TPA: hypothetical protein VMW27_14245 [Thermoanaerobaculia bacterium]|nr:hypothetical protein [Thermoanaerobaculia bacterium]